MNQEGLYFNWLHQLSNLIHHGHDVSPRGKAVKELIGYSLIVEDMAQNIIVHPERNLNYRFMTAEWLWIATGRNDLAALTRFNSKMAEYSDDGVTLDGAYGKRLAGQWPAVYHKLHHDPDTRQAVVTIYKPTDIWSSSKDIPCTISLQFMIRFGKLNCIATMRSSDAWLGIPYDFYSFSMLAIGLAGELGVTPGMLVINAGSSHLYRENELAANKLLSYPELGETVSSPYLPHMGREWMNSWFDDPGELFGEYGNPWKHYHQILTRSKSSIEALGILRNAGREPGAKYASFPR